MKQWPLLKRFRRQSTARLKSGPSWTFPGCRNDTVRSPRVSKGVFGKLPSLTVGLLPLSKLGGNEMANPFVHVELNTTDVEKAKSFYSQMFDWKMEDMDMGPSGTYTVIKAGEGTGGGVLKNPMPGVPSFWLAYVLVDDIRAATEKARSLGAKIVNDSVEVPNMGWLTIIGDPTGAALGLWQPKQKM